MKSKSLFLTELTYKRCRMIPVSTREAKQLFELDMEDYEFCGRPVFIVDDNGVLLEGELQRQQTKEKGGKETEEFLDVEGKPIKPGEYIQLDTDDKWTIQVMLAGGELWAEEHRLRGCWRLRDRPRCYDPKAFNWLRIGELDGD